MAQVKSPCDVRIVDSSDVLPKLVEVKNQGVFVKHYAPAATESKQAIFSTQVKVKVTRSSTLVSFERALLVEYACQIRSLYLQTNKQTGQKSMQPIIRTGA